MSDEQINNHIETKEMFPKMNEISRFDLIYRRKCIEKSFSKIEDRKRIMIQI
jgi:hypothetical protein